MAASPVLIKRRTATGLAVAVSAVGLVAVPALWSPVQAAPLPAGCSGAGAVVTCTYTADGSWTVPAGITSFGVVAVGGNGGNGGVLGTSGSVCLGGSGAKLMTTVPTNGLVANGQVLTFTVAGNGSAGTAAGVAAAGGNHGGGAGAPSTVFGGGGGGGGATTLLGTPGPGERLLVAAGGGGAGGCAVSGFGAGGNAGANGGNGDTFFPGDVAAVGGKTIGNGGAGFSNPSLGAFGAAGSSGSPTGGGGNGGIGSDVEQTGGGGGGAGYVGAGGGGGGGANAGGGGGGGALSYAGVWSGASSAPGDGTPRISFSYTRSTPTVGVTPTAATVAEGSATSSTATLPGSVNATGTVKVDLYKIDPLAPVCDNTTLFSSTSSAASGAGPYSGASVKPADGTYSWVATYSGDALLAPVATVCGEPSSRVTVTPDLSAPTAKITAAGSTNQLVRQFTLKWTGTDTGTGVANYDVRYRKAAWNAAFGPLTLSRIATTGTSLTLNGAPGTQYCFSVRSHDTAGNVSPWSAERCTAIPLDDRKLKSAGGWARIVGNAYLNKTATTSKKTDKTLTLAGAAAGRGVLVVSKGVGFGSVEVLYNGKVVKTISLAGAPKNKVLVTLPKLTAKKTTIVLRTKTKKTVKIDGIILARR